MGKFHYDDTSVDPVPKSQPPAATVSTDQAPHSTVRSGFSSAQKTLVAPTVDDTQPSQSAPRSSDQKHHPPPAVSNNNPPQRKLSDVKPVDKPAPPPSVDSNHQPPLSSQTQGRHQSHTRPGSTHYDIRVVNVTYNVTPPQTPLQAQAANPTNGQHSRARSQPAHADDAQEGTSRDNQATTSTTVQVFCSLVFFAGLVNLIFFAYFFDVHKVSGLLVMTCLMTGATLLDIVNAFCTRSRCWYALSFCFWVPVIVIWITYLIYYSIYWADECPLKDGDSQCVKLIAPVWIFNVPLFLLVMYYAVSLRDVACRNG